MNELTKLKKFFNAFGTYKSTEKNCGTIIFAYDGKIKYYHIPIIKDETGYLTDYSMETLTTFPSFVFENF